MAKGVRPSDSAIEAAPFDPMNPRTWPDGIWQFLPNVPSDRDAIEAYKFWLTIEAARRPPAATPEAPSLQAPVEQPAGTALASVYTTRKGGPHIPGKSRSWMLDNAKTMLGAYKAGRDWIISAADYEKHRMAQDTARVRASTPDPREVAAARTIAESTLAKAGLRPTKGGE